MSAATLVGCDLSMRSSFPLRTRADFKWAVGVIREYRLIDRCPVLFDPLVPAGQPDPQAGRFVDLNRVSPYAPASAAESSGTRKPGD